MPDHFLTSTVTRLLPIQYPPPLSPWQKMIKVDMPRRGPQSGLKGPLAEGGALAGGAVE